MPFIILKDLRKKFKSRRISKPPNPSSQAQVHQQTSGSKEAAVQLRPIFETSTPLAFCIEGLASVEDRTSELDQHQNRSPILPKEAVARGDQFQPVHDHNAQTEPLIGSSTYLPARSSISQSQYNGAADEVEMEEEGVTALSDTLDPSLVSLWLRYCEEHHGSGCSNRELERDFSAELDIIVIDTRQKCLVRVTTAARYLALSYVWGAVAQLQNSMALSESLMKPDALLAYKDAIPTVIIEAMEVVNAIGENYLWVDSLCIIQDDAAVKHHQISHMASIYSSAVLTLAAVGARDANSDIPGVRPGTRWPREKQKQNELNRPLRPDLVLKAIDRTVYVSRAWTFQERHLSRRCLYFLDEQIYFQCRKELWCEEPSPVLLSKFHPTSLPDIGLSTMSRAPAWAESIRQGEWDRGFAFYAEIIQEYSWKALSYPEDIVKAFSGILSALEAHSGWDLTHGLPEQLIDWALLWTPAGVHERRPPPHSGPLLQFPSWSWIGWIGPITFNFVFEAALVPLRSLLKEVEVETFGENTTSFRSSRRVVTGKLSETHGRWETLNAKHAVSGNSMTLNRDPSFVPGNTLRFSAMTMSASIFEAKEMPPWRWQPETYSDKRARGEQNGVCIASSTGIVGRFLGITMQFLRRYQWSHLRLIAISQMDLSLSPFYQDAIVPSPQEISNKFWELYRTWVYNVDYGFQPYGEIYYVMLVQRRGPYTERVAVGQIGKHSWDSENSVEETVLLV